MKTKLQSKFTANSVTTEKTSEQRSLIPALTI